MENNNKPARINVTIPREVHTAAKVRSVLDNMTIGDIVSEALKLWVAHQEEQNKDRDLKVHAILGEVA